MNADWSARRPVPAVGVVCLRGDDILLVRRATAPFQGHWSLPGGRIEWGESAEAAALRELKEETGCDAEIIDLIAVVDLLPTYSGAETSHYVLIDYVARWTGGEPRAGDDALDARFFNPSALAALSLWTETLRIIEIGRARI